MAMDQNTSPKASQMFEDLEELFEGEEGRRLFWTLAEPHLMFLCTPLVAWLIFVTLN